MFSHPWCAAQCSNKSELSRQAFALSFRESASALFLSAQLDSKDTRTGDRRAGRSLCFGYAHTASCCTGRYRGVSTAQHNRKRRVFPEFAALASSVYSGGVQVRQVTRSAGKSINGIVEDVPYDHRRLTLRGPEACSAGRRRKLGSTLRIA